MKKYSIIVPVYNVESVLPRCIDSILAQTFSDFELILIDDGSPDRCGIICDEYAKKDTRIKVIHQENQGVSCARNNGLDAAEGKYIVFIDSDDFIYPDYLEHLSQPPQDLVVSGQITYNPSFKVEAEITAFPILSYIGSETNQIAFLKQWYSIQVTGKRFTRHIINRNQIYFDPTISYGEDSIFLAQYLLAVSDIAFVPHSAYCFCKSETPSLSKLNIDHFFTAYSVLQEKLFNIFSDFNLTQHYLAERYCWAAENEINKICKSTFSGKHKKQLLRNVLSQSHLQICLKICYASLSFRTRILYKLRNPAITLFIYSSR